MSKAEVVKFDVVAVNGKERELTFFDSKLIEHTKNLQNYRDAGNMAILAIANELNEMDVDKSYEKAGFKTVTDYANALFDYKHSTVSLYLRCAKSFFSITDGKLVMNGNLPKLTIGQMIELLPLVSINGDNVDISEVEEAFTSSRISQLMSTKDLRHEVNAIRGKEISSKDGKPKTAVEKSAKLGKHSKDDLPKGMESIDYIKTHLQGAMECMDLVAEAISDIEHNSTVDTKISKVTTMLQELFAEISK